MLKIRLNVSLNLSAVQNVSENVNLLNGVLNMNPFAVSEWTADVGSGAVDG